MPEHKGNIFQREPKKPLCNINAKPENALVVDGIGATRMWSGQVVEIKQFHRVHFGPCSFRALRCSTLFNPILALRAYAPQVVARLVQKICRPLANNAQCLVRIFPTQCHGHHCQSERVRRKVDCLAAKTILEALGKSDDFLTILRGRLHTIHLSE
jgi:hypothetical protein